MKEDRNNQNVVEQGSVPKSMKKIRLKRPVNLEGIERINADIEQGLSTEQVAGQIEKGCVNVSVRRTNKTYLGIILSNTFTFFNILAFIAAIAMAFTKPTMTQMFFIVIIFTNIGIGIFQEIKAKLSVDKLKIITAPSATVIRDGQKKIIPLEEVVLDDIIYLDTGKQIAADSVILSGDCEVNESMITGESVSVKKTKGDILYSGSYLSSGNVYARVDKVGDANYAQALTVSAKKYQKPKSELNNSIRLIMKIATIFIIPITFAMILTHLFQHQGNTVEDAIRSISGAVIGMIPAGMFLLTTFALARSVLKLANKKTLVKDLYCIEMLARVDTLCLDKTGTITDGSMTVKKVINFKNDEMTVPIETVIGSMLSATEDNNQTALALAAKFGYNTELKANKIVPFSSQRKYSMVSFDEIGTYALGAPEYVLKDMGVRMERLVNENTSAGYRVIMLVHSGPTHQIQEGDKLPASRKAVCMIVIEDHIREDAIETIKWFKENDVNVKIISGDNPITVSEIGKRVGVENAELYISLDGLSDQEIIEASSKYTVFGRVTPEQKSLLVRSMKARGRIVAMTGDGINDILAMREADCAIAIASGAEAARNVSHLVLVDNNFTSMPDIVLEGRKVVNNIQKSSVLFLMKTIMSIFLALIYVIWRKPYPITTENLLLLELLVIGLPSIFLALQPNQNRIQGRFLTNVVGRAMPGGLALILAVISVEVFSALVPNAITDEMKMSMIVICLTFTGFIVFCKICEPINFYRAFLIILSGLALLIATLMWGRHFGINNFNSEVDYFDLTCLLFIISEVLLSYFVITLISKLLKRSNIIFD